MRTLVTTFGPGDASKAFDAMRTLPYDKLVLIGERGAGSCPDFVMVSDLEAVSGHGVDFVETARSGFLELVDEVADALVRLSKGDDGGRNDVVLNVSGGTKLLGNAALFAAFRLGIRTYHCDGKAVKLPVLTGATSKDRFTPGQLRMIGLLDHELTLAEAVEKMQPTGRQGTERTIRELRKADLLSSEAADGRIMIRLTPAGREVLRAIHPERSGGR